MQAPRVLQVATGIAGLAVPALIGCSGTLTQLGRVEQTVGQASYYDIMKEVPEVLATHGYTVYDDTPNGPNLYIETGWQERAPFDDEAAQGITYARTRFIAQARKASADTYTLRIRAENQVQVGEGATATVAFREGTPWGTMGPTGDYTAYVHQVTSEIEMRVAAGVRTIR